MAKIVILSHEKLEEYHVMIERHHATLPDIWETIDGLKTRIHEASNGITESHFYNGWKIFSL